MPQLSLLNIVDGKVRTDLKCAACELGKARGLKTNRMEGSGVSRPTYMFVGLSPGVEDDRIGKPMTGENGRIFRDLLREAGIPWDEVYVTNCVKCCSFGAKPKDAWFKSCHDYLVSEIRRLQPKVLVAVGAQAMTWMTGHHGIKKLRRRGLPYKFDTSRSVFPIQQPVSMRYKDEIEAENLRQEMVDDLVWLKEQVQRNRTHRAGDIDTDYQIAKTPEDVDRFFAEIENRDDLACDLETTSLFPEEGEHVVAVGWSWADGVGRAIPVYARGVTSYNYWPDEYVEKVLVPRFRNFFLTKRVFGQNFLQFDQKWTRFEFGVERCKINFDTMLGHYVLDEEGAHDLEHLAMLFTTMPPWKEEIQKLLQDTARLGMYLCRDVDATGRVRREIEPLITGKLHWLLHELLIPLAYEMMEVEWRGVAVNRGNIERLHEYLQKRIAEENAALRENSVVAQYETATNSVFNPASTQQLRVLMQKFLKLPCIKRTKDSDQYSTDKEVLAAYSHVPVIQTIQQLRGLQKALGTYCEGMQEHIKKDNRIHTSYRIHRTVTGRPASADPNLSNIPRDDTAGKVLEDGKAIKNIFAASDGCCLLQADYSQIELRVLAALSGDTNLRNIYLNNQDAHTATAAKVFGIQESLVTKAQRSMAKCVDPSTIIFWNGELKKVADLELPNETQTFIPVTGYTQNGLGRPVQVHSTYCDGEKERYAVITKEGTVICSDRHRFLTADGRWVSIAGGLKEGVVLASSSHDELIQDKDYQPLSHCYYDGLPPAVVTPTHDLAYMAGVFVGGGTVCGNVSVSICTGPEGQQDTYGDDYCVWRKILRDHLTKCEIMIDGGGEGSKSIRCGSRNVMRFFRTLGLIKEKKVLEIPGWVLSAGRTAILHFVAGLIDTDGWVTKEGQVSICTKSRVLSGQVLAALRGLGIDARQCADYNTTYDRYYLRIVISKRASAVFKDFLKYPGKLERLKASQGAAYRQFAPNTVLRIEKLSPGVLYDISVDSDDHSYWANALVTHNTVNFGVVYGLGLESLLEKFKAAGNTEEEGRHFYESHKKTFSGVWEFMDEQERIIRTRKFQETPFGRRRRYGEIDNRAIRQAYNFMIQSTASEFAHIALMRVAKIFRELKMKTHLVLTVYDSVIYDTPFEEFWDAAEIIKHVMESLEYTWLTVPIKADLETGLTWGSLKKVDVAKRTIGQAA